jgi:2-oxoglutarate ferredoxin oxidoreductase subunit alpha
MTHTTTSRTAFIDGSLLIVEALVQTGAEVFIGYPITPANLLYSYANRRFPTMMAAPDEITALQWMSGFATLGKLPVTATAFPGYALMVESINMALMMELPMVVILAQRLGPATGTATAGAQGDLNLVHGTVSGGFQIPTFCISNLDDCWSLSAKAVETAMQLRTPVVLLTSKEMVMTQMSYDLDRLTPLKKSTLKHYTGTEPYKPYHTDESLIPEFLPVSQSTHQVRFTASTHNKAGILQNTTPEALDNTKRLKDKLDLHADFLLHYHYEEDNHAKVLVISFDQTAQAAREAVAILRQQGTKVAHLIAKTLFPIPQKYYEISALYSHIIVAEENLDGQYRRLLFGSAPNTNVSGVNAIGRMIHPDEIIEEVKKHE